MFELLLNIVVKMMEAKCVGGIGKHSVDSLDKALSPIGKKDKGIAIVGNEVVCMSL